MWFKSARTVQLLGKKEKERHQWGSNPRIQSWTSDFKKKEKNVTSGVSTRTWQLICMNIEYHTSSNIVILLQ